MKILLIEYDKDLNNIVSKLLRERNHIVDSVFDKQEATAFLNNKEYDVIIMEESFQQSGNYELLKQIRREGNTTPVLILLANTSINNHIKGMDHGANDYLIKPFAFDELLFLINKITKKTNKENNIIRFKNLVLDGDNLTLKYNDQLIKINIKEYILLKLFINNSNKNLSKETIDTYMWKFNDDEVGGIESYIDSLNNKMNLISKIDSDNYILKGETHV